MAIPTRLAALATLTATLAATLVATTGFAETLRCQSINGNVTCAGSSGTSCQTINGHTVCASGDGAAVQSFGATAAPRAAPRSDGASTEADDDAAAAAFFATCGPADSAAGASGAGSATRTAPKGGPSCAW